MGKPSKTTTPKQIDDSCPSWVDAFEAKIQKSIEKLRLDIQDDIQKSIEFSIHDLSKKQEELQKNTDGNSASIAVINQRMANFSDRMKQVELSLLKYNLVISGIPETTQEESPLELQGKVLRLLQDDLGIADIVLAECFRSGFKKPTTRPRNVIIRLLNINDKARVLRSAHKLKGKAPPIYINQQLPKDIEYWNRLLVRVSRAAKAKGHNMKVFHDRIDFDGKSFTICELLTNQLPFDVFAMDTDFSSENLVFFFGGLSPFSNFFCCKFEYKGITFTSSEQLIQWCKAVYHNKPDTAVDILAQENPATIKAAGEAIPSGSAWQKDAEKTVLPGLTEKFRQNKKIGEYLKRTGTKVLAEANKYDKFWGIGCERNENSQTWVGKNVLGKLLMEIRQNLT